MSASRLRRPNQGHPHRRARAPRRHCAASWRPIDASGPCHRRDRRLGRLTHGGRRDRDRRRRRSSLFSQVARAVTPRGARAIPSARRAPTQHESASGAAGRSGVAAKARSAARSLQSSQDPCAARARKHAHKPRIRLHPSPRATALRAGVATPPPGRDARARFPRERPRTTPRYPSFSPASTRRYCPVTMRVRSLANSTATSATSSSGGISRIGKRFAMCAITASSLVLCCLACHFT
jgi:hypothetical protein